MRAMICAIAVAALAGCTSVQSVKEAQGSGQKKLYKASFEKVRDAIPKAIQATGGTIRESDAARCATLAHYGAKGFGFGEQVGVFCSRRLGGEIEVEIVSRRGIAVGGSVTNRDAQIFGALDNELGP